MTSKANVMRLKDTLSHSTTGHLQRKMADFMLSTLLDLAHEDQLDELCAAMQSLDDDRVEQRERLNVQNCKTTALKEHAA